MDETCKYQEHACIFEILMKKLKMDINMNLKIAARNRNENRKWNCDNIYMHA